MLEKLESEKDIFIDNTSLSEMGNIKIRTFNMSPLIAKTSTVEVPGINGVLDISYSIFDYLRYEERSLTVEFIVFEQTREAALEVIKKVNDLILKKELKVSFTKDSAIFFKGRVEGSVEYEQEFNGLFYCTLVIQCYPYSVKSYSNDMLWDDIYFITDYFNRDLFVEVESNQSKVLNIYFPKDYSGELDVVSTFKGSIQDTNHSGIEFGLVKGLNKITTLMREGGVIRFMVRNKDLLPGTVSLMFKTEVLDYV